MNNSSNTLFISFYYNTAATQETMIIGFDAKRAFQNMTGLGNYSRMLICELAKQHKDVDSVLYAPNMDGYYKTFFTGYANISTRQPHGFDKHLPRLWRSFGVSFHVSEDKIDIFHGLSHELPMSLPKDVKKVVTMHDLIAWRHPEYFSKLDAKIHQKKQQIACKEADVVIAISEQTKRDLIEFIGVPEQKIRVLYQSCDPIFRAEITDEDRAEAKKNYDLPDRYIICVGTIEERKNQATVVAAMNLLPNDLHLVLVGGTHGNYRAKLFSEVKSEDLKRRIHIIDDADFDDFPALYANSLGAIYISHFEGFGIPILEAMSCGVPVLTSNCSSMPEVGGDAVLYATPDNVDEVASQIKRMISDEALRQDLIAKSKIQIQKFDPKVTTQALYDLYTELMKEA